MSETKPIDRYVFDAPTETNPGLPPLQRDRAYVVRHGAVYAYNLLNRREIRLATAAPGISLAVSRDSLIIGSNENSNQAISVTAIDRFRGTPLWSRNAGLLGAGLGHVLALTTSKNGIGFSHGAFVDFNSSRGTVTWSDSRARSLCAPSAPVTFLAEWALILWNGACQVLPDPPFLMWVRLRDDARHDTQDATAFLTRRDRDVYLTGDNAHYAEYGPGNLSVYDAQSSKLLREEKIAPDPPQNVPVAFATTAGGYALANALWVGLKNTYPYVFASAVYRYDLHDWRGRPARVDPSFGRWLGAAHGDETYFGRDQSLVAVVARSGSSAIGVRFSGRVTNAAEAVVDERDVYVREQGGRIAISDRATRRQIGVVAAQCAKLQTVRTIGLLRYAICLASYASDRTTPAREAIIAFKPERSSDVQNTSRGKNVHR